jgi:hypothetical protein
MSNDRAASTRGMCGKMKVAAIIAIPHAAPVEVPNLLFPPIALIANP